MKKFLLFFGVAFVPCAVCLAAQDDKSEPPAQYSLQVNGKAVPLTLENEVTQDVAGGQTRPKLSLNPLRQFDKSGFKFKYPVSYTFEADMSDPIVSTWTINGVNSVLILNRFPSSSLSELSEEITNELIHQYGQKNVVISPVSMTFGKRLIKGKRIKATIAQEKLTQEIFAFSTIRHSFVLIIQDLPNVVGETLETKKLKSLLSSSLIW